MRDKLLIKSVDITIEVVVSTCKSVDSCTPTKSAKLICRPKNVVIQNASTDIQKHANVSKVVKDVKEKIVTNFMALWQKRRILIVNISVKDVRIFGKTKAVW